jgi:hypothetical protein
MIGASIGFMIPATEIRRLLENVALGGALGAIAGTFLACAMHVGIALGGWI